MYKNVDLWTWFAKSNTSVAGTNPTSMYYFRFHAASLKRQQHERHTRTHSHTHIYACTKPRRCPGSVHITKRLLYYTHPHTYTHTSTPIRTCTQTHAYLSENKTVPWLLTGFKKTALWSTWLVVMGVSLLITRVCAAPAPLSYDSKCTPVKVYDLNL